ncbi:hypothetical protein CY34DRAFT_811863 [Suillus luteus UH-Slu-Lm8-n1]|uniref:Unplaced genomic scaffold CY34scaffold_456, whole genome shotgun sequence n=1 Tax=Suillus luteus UH-Slu-Lm8-n1 TaxID=930992 RepID=A0A0D0A222_9AGAM|nr:hypothetical protein CY34DRAFT_811863 [Suillus luteus UH-Slu-Lm8-n1]
MEPKVGYVHQLDYGSTDDNELTSCPPPSSRVNHARNQWVILKRIFADFTLISLARQNR